MTEFQQALIRELHAWYELADETVGSWHRFVDAVERIAENMESE